jgi:hypothetical protein
LTPTDNGRYSALFSGHGLKVSLSATTDNTNYYLPITIRDTVTGKIQNEVIDPELFVHGSTAVAGIRQKTAVIKDIFGAGGASLEVAYRFEQLSDSLKVRAEIVSATGADVPVITEDSKKYTGITKYSPYTSNPGPLTVRFTSSGIDTASTSLMRYFPYLTVELYDRNTGALVNAGNAFVSTGYRQGATQQYAGKANRYYLSGTLSNNEAWDFGGLLTINNSRVAFDFTDRGSGSGKPGSSFSWGSMHRSGTKDFQIGDSVTVEWTGGVKGDFPQGDVIVNGAAPSLERTTNDMMEKIKIVPNPYIVRHEAQRGLPRLYFNYLPDECTIRIYTLALDLVRTIHHSGGSREEWDLQSEGGQLVASQMLYAYIDAPTGAKTIKKFGVIVGK